MSLSGKIALIANAIFITCTIPIFFGFQYPMILSYPWHKMLHIFGIVMMMGNMMIGPIWIMAAMQTKDEQKLRFSFQTLAKMDIYFTIPGAALALFNGLPLATFYGGAMNVPWISQSLIMLAVAWLFSITFVLYWQERVLKIAETGTIDKNFWKAYAQWAIWGSFVMIPFSLIYYLMVAKVPLW